MVVVNSIYLNYERVQYVLETISNILNLHIEMVDDSLIRVCGTGILKKHIGEKVVLNGIVSQLLVDQKCTKAIIIDKDKDEQCKICMATNNGICRYKKAVFQTIEFENKIIGALGIASMDIDDDKEFLKHSETALWKLLEKMSNLVFTCIEDSKTLKQLEYSNEIISKIINKTDAGILILDEFARIQYMNDFCEKKFYINRNDCLNKNIKTILPGLDLNKNKNKLNYNGKNIDYKIENIKNELDCMKKSIIYLTNTKESTDNYPINNMNNIWSIDNDFLDFKNLVLQFSKTESTILLVGETGTGKELFAKSIHDNSTRSNNPFIVINCNTIPDSLIESTLFGYEKGSFTGASTTGKEGKFFAANNGTIFLDEIEAIPLHIQTKLLRVIENRTIEKVGGIKEIPINIRIIGATNISLEKLVEEGKFREDLYHRLNVVTLNIPPLRERRKDILFLATKFLEVQAKNLEKNIHGLDEELKNIFLNHRWKGNVRELKNVIEYAAILEKSEYLTKSSLPKNFFIPKAVQQIKTMAETEKEQILQCLKIYGCTNEGKQNAASALGISRATLYRKIKEYSISVFE